MIEREYMGRAYSILCKKLGNKWGDITDKIVKSACEVEHSGREYKTFEEMLEGEGIRLSKDDFYYNLKKMWEESEEGVTINIMGRETSFPRKSSYTVITCDPDRIEQHDVDQLKYYMEVHKLVCPIDYKHRHER